MWAMTVWERDEETLVDVHVGSAWAEPPDGEINERRHEVDDDQRHGAHTEVEDASFACATDSGSQIFCGGYGDGGRSRGAFNNGGLGLNSQVRERTGSHVAKAIASRSGLGKTDILKYLWLRVTKSGRAHIHIHRAPGERNLAEHLMKGNTLCDD